MIKKAFFHIFETPYHKYLYDVNTNEILAISEQLYMHLKKYLKEDPQITNVSFSLPPELQDEIMQLESNGYLKSKHPLVLENPEIKNIDYLMSHHLRHLILQVTQQCNFRCSYCPYTIGDNWTQRSHSSTRMEWKTAKKAIDFFAERIRDTSLPVIGFYGGEPLLEFELIKKTVLYAEDKMKGKNVVFNMTTNVTLMTEEIARFLTEKKFNLLISLDGPAEIHDRSRRFAVDGTGTFHAVMEKVKKYSETIPGFARQLSFNAVLDPENDLAKVMRFFRQPLFQLGTVTVADVVPPRGTKLVYTPQYIQESRKQGLLALLAVSGEIKSDSLDTMARKLYETIVSEQLRFVPRQELQDSAMHAGPCIPGIHKTFITANGDILPCEQCSETSDCMNLGNVFEGFNRTSVINLINKTANSQLPCRDCWAISNCTLCAAQVDGYDNRSLQGQKCRSVRLDADRKLKKLAALQEVKALERERLK